MTKVKPWKKDDGNRGFILKESQKMACMRAALEVMSQEERFVLEKRRSEDRMARKAQEWDLSSLESDKHNKGRKSNRSAYSDGSVGSGRSSKAGQESEVSRSSAGQADSASADKPAKRPRGKHIRGGKRGQKHRGKNASKQQVEHEIEMQARFIDEPSANTADELMKTTPDEKSQDDFIVKPCISYADAVKKKRLRIRKTSASNKRQVSWATEDFGPPKTEQQLLAELMWFFRNYIREDWNVIRRREEEEWLNADPILLEKKIAYDEAMDRWNTNRWLAKGCAASESSYACPLRIERDYCKKIAETAYMPPGKRAAATPQKKAGPSGEEPQGESTGYESSGQESESSGNAGGSGGGGNDPEKGQKAAEFADRALLGTLTGFTVWWCNGWFHETYGLNIYLCRRAKALKEKELMRVRMHDKVQAEAAYNRRFGEGFRPLKAGTNGELIAYSEPYGKEGMEEDYKVLQIRTNRRLKDGSEETFEDCERTARNAGTMSDIVDARAAIPVEARQAVYEAFDRYFTVNAVATPMEMESMTSEATAKSHFSRTATKDWESMGTLELLSYRTDLTFTPGPIGIRQGMQPVEKASFGQLMAGAGVDGLTTIDPLQGLGGEALKELVLEAYCRMTTGSTTDEIVNYWFKDGLLSEKAKQALKSIELQTQVKASLDLLSTPIENKTIEVEKRMVTETYGMNVWRFHFGESNTLDVPDNALVTASSAFKYMLRICPFSRLWETLFLGRDLPTEEEVLEQDEELLSTDTGGVTTSDGLDVAETYGMVAYRHRWFNTPMQVAGIPDVTWPTVMDAFTRRTSGMTKNDCEVFIYKTLPNKKAKHEQLTTASTSSAGKEEEPTSFDETAMEVDPTSHPTGTAGPTQGQPQVDQTQGAVFTPMVGTPAYGGSDIPILGMGRRTDAAWRGGTGRGGQPPYRYFNQPRANMVYCRDCRTTHESGNCRRRFFGYGRTGDAGQTVSLQPGVCNWCGEGHDTIDCPGPKPQESEEDYRTCFTCREKHARGQCPKRQETAQHEQATRGTGRPASQGTTRAMAASGTARTKRAFTESLASTQASVASVEPPKAPELGYKPPAKRAASMSQKKQVSPIVEVSHDTPNGAAVGSYLAGHRVVRPEVLRHLGKEVIVTKEFIPTYTIVLATDGYGVGYLDPLDNEGLSEGHKMPLLMQFGDRLTKIGFYFFNGEKRKVLAYVSALKANGEAEPLQPSTMSLTECIDPTTGRLKANAICKKQVPAKEAPGKVMRRVCLVHSFHQTRTDDELVSWQAQICSADGRGGSPIQVDNDFITRQCIGFSSRDWATIDGFKVIKGFPRYSLGEALFLTQVPDSVKVQDGFYVVRMYPSDCRQLLDSFKPDWQTGERSMFAMHHRKATEACGAVFHLNSVLTKEKVEQGRLQVTNTHIESPGLYKFVVSCAGLEDDDLHAACSIHGPVSVMETKVDDTMQEVMHGVVSHTEFEGDNISVVYVRHTLNYDTKKLAAMVKDFDIADEETITTTRGLDEACDMLKGISLSEGLNTDFYQKNIKGRKLTIVGREPSFVDDAFLGMIPRLALCNTREGEYGTALTSNLNGLQIQKGRNWTADYVYKEASKYAPRAMDTRYRELQFAGRMLKTIADSGMDEEQKQVCREMVVNYLPCVNVIAPGGTGKTETGVNVIALSLDRYRSLKAERMKIAVVCPNNDSATAFAHRLQALVDRRVLDRMGALVVQSMTQIIDMKKEGPFSMQARARHFIERNYGTPQMLELLKDFLDISAKKVQMLFNMTAVLETLLKFEKPEVIIVTIDSLALNPALWKYCRMVILEESSRLPDIKVRALIYRMELVEQVLVLGDPAQQTPFIDKLELEPFVKFGMVSTSELLMWRGGNVPQVVLTKNRRSVSTLVHCIRQMNPLYASMVSMVKEPDWVLDPNVSAPPLVTVDCPIVLLNISGAHRTSKAVIVSNEEQDSLAAGLVKVLDELNKINGKSKLDVMVTANYNGSKHAMQAQVKGVKFAKNCGILTVDGAQGKEADRTIWVTGRASPPLNASTGRTDFAKETRRCTVALGRPRNVIYIIGRFDYLTQQEGTPLFNYIMEANKRTPVVDGQWYLKKLHVYLDKVRTEHKAGSEAIYPEVFAFGNGVLYHDFIEGVNELRQDHIVDCRCNIANKWKDRSRFEPAENLVDYVPPRALPFNAPLDEPGTIAQEEAMTGD